MKNLDVELLKSMFIKASETVVEQEPYLTRIDTLIGDGDHGIGMKRGFQALGQMLKQNSIQEVDTLCNESGLELVKTMGGASGVIFGTMFIGGVHKLPHASSCSLPEFAAYLKEGEAAIRRRGKAKAGQKTMLDALIPAAGALLQEAEKGGEIESGFRGAYQKALEGVELSKTMLSRVGRSKNFRNGTIGYPDPGAVSTSLIFKAFYETVKEQTQ